MDSIISLLNRYSKCFGKKSIFSWLISEFCQTLTIYFFLDP